MDNFLRMLEGNNEWLEISVVNDEQKVEGEEV